MENKRIKVGIAGVRGMSTVMGFNAIDGVEISALCDLDEEVLCREGDKLNIPKQHRYRVFEDMLESDIDAVVIATPMQCHMPQAVAALEAGKHVMSEVTAGVTMDELWWLCEAVEKYGKTYMMAENYSRQGYMKEAMQAVIDYLFVEEKLECVSARVFAPNTASRALLKSLGFSENGTIPRCVKGYTGEIFDDVIHTLFSEHVK